MVFMTTAKTPTSLHQTFVTPQLGYGWRVSCACGAHAVRIDKEQAEAWAAEHQIKGARSSDVLRARHELIEALRPVLDQVNADVEALVDRLQELAYECGHTAGRVIPF